MVFRAALSSMLHVTAVLVVKPVSEYSLIRSFVGSQILPICQLDGIELSK